MVDIFLMSGIELCYEIYKLTIFRDDLAKTTINPGHVSDISPKTSYHFAIEFFILR